MKPLMNIIAICSVLLSSIAVASAPNLVWDWPHACSNLKLLNPHVFIHEAQHIDAICEKIDTAAAIQSGRSPMVFSHLLKYSHYLINRHGISEFGALPQGIKGLGGVQGAYPKSSVFLFAAAEALDTFLRVNKKILTRQQWQVVEPILDRLAPHLSKSPAEFDLTALRTAQQLAIAVNQSDLKTHPILGQSLEYWLNLTKFLLPAAAANRRWRENTSSWSDPEACTHLPPEELVKKHPEWVVRRYSDGPALLKRLTSVIHFPNNTSQGLVTSSSNQVLCQLSFSNSPRSKARSSSALSYSNRRSICASESLSSVSRSSEV